MPAAKIRQRMKTAMTMLVERSGCSKIKNSGTAANTATDKRTSGRLIFSWYFSRYQEKKRIRPIFTNSEGWKRPMTGSSIHRIEPPPKAPFKITAARITIQPR